MQALPEALAPLGAYRQFLVCKLVPKADKPGKTDKLPCNVYAGKVGVDAHDPNNWLDAATALATVQAWGHGYCLGFAFTEADPFWFLDIDDCLTPDGWSVVSQQLCAMFPGAAVEVSQSGRGLHIFGTGRAPEHGCKNVPLGLEFYTRKRFVALTGTGAMGSAATDCTAALGTLVAHYFPAKVAVAGTPADWSEGPSEDWHGPTDDEELLRRALASQSAKSVFGKGATFRDLWQADEAVLAQAYPSGSGDVYDRSSADAALAQHLAFWTGRDCERMERLMRRSALVRDKWDDRSDYLRDRTIMSACRMQREVLRDKPIELPAAAVATQQGEAVAEPEQREVQGGTFLPPGAQVEFFKGCVYVTDLNKVLVPGGYLRNQDRFKVIYGGYTFAMDAMNERTTRNAWEAFTESQVLRRPVADSVCFMPTKPAGALIQEAGRVRVNMWVPVEVPRKTGDAGPFLRHLTKLLPNERDRNIALYYLAACVQHQGVKFQWAPLFQGVEGNGKTLLSLAVASAIGPRYVHWPKASQLASPFNHWLCGTTAILVEDIHIKRGNVTVDVIEELKPMITAGAGYEIQKKGEDQISTEICCNFVFNSNHKDGLIKTRNDRRFAPFYTAQQNREDLARDGMGGNYFQQLYAWYKADGAAIVSELLWTLPIPDEFNPATGCQRAPDTSSTTEAIEFGMGSVEQEVLEAIEQGVSGFRGGWVSSIQLDRLLDRINKGGIPINKRRGLMQGLGYDWHPALSGGRVNNDVMPDGGKPRLYVKLGSPAASITSPAEVAKTYTNAQIGAILKAGHG
jgi:hypothetical protein